eukprot:gi/632978630/ref/XP_007906021.1/ PREDICTED: serine/threonine-protein kinase ULK1 [Callorhinchus milii]
MESVGRFEFSRKDLIGHGAFAVVFKGRHKEKHEWEVAIKYINKKNLAKSHTLLGKEIKILKELKHDNIVALHDFQEMTNAVYLVMEYCNGGDLADYLHVKGTLSEDTIRVFLQQIAGAMKLLHSKGIIHRDLKPQNILLTCAGGRKSNPSTICIKIADFGFARYLQSNMLAATLCGSPMYMAPEVIMSQHYDAKADLWSIGTMVYQCLTGKAPFQANSPQDLRLFYEKNRNLTPNIPRETSSDLHNLLLGLLQRDHQQRMEFSEFFHHPFLEISTSLRKSAPVQMRSDPGSASGSSCSSSSTSHLASPPNVSLCGAQQLSDRTLAPPTPASPGFLLSSTDSGKNSACDIDDFVLVPYSSQVPGDLAEGVDEERTAGDSLVLSGSLLTSAGMESRGPISSSSASSCSCSPSGRTRTLGSYGESVPIPVPTQIHNFQRIEENLQSPKQSLSPRSGSGSGRESTAQVSSRAGISPPQGSFAARKLLCGVSKVCPTSLPGAETDQLALRCRLHSAPNLSALPATQHRIKKQRSEPAVTQYGYARGPGLVPCRPMPSCSKLCELMQRSPLPTIIGSPTKAISPFEFPIVPSSHNLVRMFAHQVLAPAPTVPDPGEAPRLLAEHRTSQEDVTLGRSPSAGKLSDLLLKAAFGDQIPDTDGNKSQKPERPTDGMAPKCPQAATVCSGAASRAGSPVPVVFTVGSPPKGTTSAQPNTRTFSVGSTGWASCLDCGGGRCSSRAPGAPPIVSDGLLSLRLVYTDALAANMETMVTFEAPELPEETLMEQEHTEILKNLRFTLVFVSCVMEIADAKGSSAEMCSSVASGGRLQDSEVMDQISLLSREWSFAEQLVLYMKVTELLSCALDTSRIHIRSGKLYPSAAVKQVVKKLNELYKVCVTFCQGLSTRLQRFFLDKQRLMDRINSITAEKLIYSYAVHMVQAAALDEMFQQARDYVQRYHKALLLMEGLTQIITDQADVDAISKCKQCIERRLSALRPGLCA